MVVGNQLQVEQSKLMCVLVPVQSVNARWDELSLATHIAHQPCSFKICYKNSTTLNRLGAVTLAAPRLFAQIKQAQKLVQLSAQVWISTSLGLEQSGKSTPSPLV